MFNDDTSSISSGGCNVITGQFNISNYNHNVRRDYIFNGGKWFLYRTQYSNYGDYDISSYSCIDVSTLNSNRQFEPFFYGMAFVLFIVAVFAFFKSIKGFLYGI